MSAHPPGPAWLRALRRIVDGELALVDPAGRRRHTLMQEVATRVSLRRMMLLLALFAAMRWLLGGDLPPPPLQFAGAAAGGLLLLALAHFYRRTTGFAQEAAVAVLYLPLLLRMLLGPSEQWSRDPELALGGVVLLPVIVLPLLVRLSSALAFVLACASTMLVFAALADVPRGPMQALWFYFAVAVAAGLKLRRARTNIGVRYARALESAWTRATVDPLSGLLNRAGWMRAAARCLDRCGDGCCMALVDLDHFKRVNDAFGHAVGDEALARVGQALAARSGATMVVARLGGEEFACLAPDTSVVAMERYLARVRADLHAASLPYQLTFSAGVAACRPGEGLERLMQRVDRALYAAKDAGRNRTIHADPPLPLARVGGHATG